MTIVLAKLIVAVSDECVSAVNQNSETDNILQLQIHLRSSLGFRSFFFFSKTKSFFSDTKTMTIFVLLALSFLPTLVYGACPKNEAQQRYGLTWGEARMKNITGNNCLYLPNTPLTTNWTDAMCVVAEYACIAPISSSRKCSWVRCRTKTDCRQDGPDFECGLVFLVEDAGGEQMAFFTLAPTPAPTPVPPTPAGPTPAPTTLPPTPRPSAVGPDGQQCGVGLLDCLCNDRFECDKPATCQREEKVLPATTTVAGATAPAGTPMPQYQFVCRCVVGNEGCDCIPSAFSEVPCQEGLVCTDSKCRVGTPSTSGAAKSTPRRTMTSIGPDGSIIVIDADIVDSAAPMETWQIAAIAAGGGLCLIITIVVIVLVAKRKGGTKSGYDWANANRGRAATYASILGDPNQQAQQAPIPAPSPVANVHVLGSSPFDPYMQQQQQQQHQQHQQQQQQHTPPQINLPPSLAPQQSTHFEAPPPPPSLARPLPVPTLPTSTQAFAQLPPTLARPLPPSPPPALASMPPHSPHQPQYHQQSPPQQQFPARPLPSSPSIPGIHNLPPPLVSAQSSPQMSPHSPTFV
jgi:hypothetical protein